MLFWCCVRFGLFVSVSAVHLSKGLKAKEWIEIATRNYPGGKFGGKDDQANGNIESSLATANQLVDAALEYSRSKV